MSTCAARGPHSALGDEPWPSRRQDPTGGGHGWLGFHSEMRQVRGCGSPHTATVTQVCQTDRLCPPASPAHCPSAQGGPRCRGASLPRVTWLRLQRTRLGGQHSKKSHHATRAVHHAPSAQGVWSFPSRAEAPGLARPQPLLQGLSPRGFRPSSSESDSPSSATATGTAFRGWEGSGESCIRDPE